MALTKNIHPRSQQMDNTSSCNAFGTPRSRFSWLFAKTQTLRSQLYESNLRVRLSQIAERSGQGPAAYRGVSTVERPEKELPHHSSAAEHDPTLLGRRFRSTAAQYASELRSDVVLKRADNDTAHDLL